MANSKMPQTPGILYVTMHPRSSDTNISEFHDWYQNEHGPNRLRLSSFNNGFRYKAVDGQTPEWMAIYDLDDMNALIDEEYTRLRSAPIQSQRERDVMKTLVIDRRFYDLSSESAGKGFKKLEDINHAHEGNVLVAAKITLKDSSKLHLYEEWFDQEHVPMLSKVPGWRRSRKFVTSAIEEGRELEILGLHEYGTENGLDGPEFQAATNTPWRKKIFDDIVKEKTRRVYHLFYIFGAAPRDIASPSHSLDYPSRKTRAIVDESKQLTAIESYITTPDGVELPFRLEGSKDPNAPVIVLVNSVLVDYGIWDGFVEEFTKEKRNQQYRILRFNSRGRYAQSGKLQVTVDLLAADIISLLDALKITQAAAIIGVSLGGVTALRFAMEYPNRTATFVACDTNAVAPSSNSKAWEERIDVAEKEGRVAEDGEQVVGEHLAEMTVRRWFTDESYEDPGKKANIDRVKKMIIQNSLEGFKTVVKALYQYDFQKDMAKGAVKGLFLVGSADGVLPKTMENMAESYADGNSKLEMVQAAGHLPMVEQPEAFTAILSSFLSQYHTIHPTRAQNNI
jgi:pimeloyl-ACP methyl ester carboxylesterase